MDLDTYLTQPLPFEAELRRYFEDRGRLVIFDIGACEAEDSIRLKRRFPNATVYAFEPLPANVRAIRRNLARYGVADVVVVGSALSDARGNAPFHVSSGRPADAPDDPWDYGNKSSSLLPPAATRQAHPWLRFERTITVQTERLDEFCRSHEIGAVDIAYIDVQGAELRSSKELVTIWTRSG